MLMLFKAANYWTVTKFIHEWFPLQECYHVQSNFTLHLCPLCCQTPETVNHFLACPHPSRQQIWKDLHDWLHKHQFSHGVSNVFHDLLAYGLYQDFQASTNLTFHCLPHDILLLYKAQECLGWRHIYYGCLLTL